ncbi:MAG: wax ester/triacylglycerol synthase family O-acyltransferase [Actinomycetes bacterium]
MSNGQRLSGLDASFLHIERGGAHMHIASCMVFDGPAPEWDKARAHIESRLHLVPKYRQRIAPVPFRQGRPMWVDDPHFNLGYHLRHAALPSPGSDADLARLCGRVFATALDRAKPLWEIYLVEGLSGNRHALLAKTHHALVDGISGVDLTAVLFDVTPEGEPAQQTPAWSPSPVPSQAELLANALLERATVPAEFGRATNAALRAPRRAISRMAERVSALGSLASPGTQPAPETPINVPIGTHRRFTWVESDLEQVKFVKNSLGGTVNDVVLCTVAGGLGSYLRSKGVTTRDLELRAMVPVSVRPDEDRGSLGNQVAVMWAPLPVGETDPVRRLRKISESMAGVKESGQAVGAKTLTELSGFAPQTIMAQAARLLPRQRFFNVVVTNVPGPQFPLYLLGSKLLHAYPMVPLAERQGLGIAVMSYNGRLDFGLNADWDALPDVELLAEDIRNSLADLVKSARTRSAKQRAKPLRATTERQADSGK